MNTSGLLQILYLWVTEHPLIALTYGATCFILGALFF